MGKSVLAVLASIVWFSFAVAANAQNSDLPVASDTMVGRSLDAPINTLPIEQKFWWSDDWFDQGKLQTPKNYSVIERSVSYLNPTDDTEVPAFLYRPKTEGKFPGVLFQHGRRGLDDLVKRLARRLAARGFVVLAPDVYEARFIEAFPLAHDPMTETDVDAGVDYLLAQPDLSSSKICLMSHTRGGDSTRCGWRLIETVRKNRSPVTFHFIPIGKTRMQPNHCRSIAITATWTI
ncbi:MAG: hypothetical protein GKR97_10500 [Rhizobiaceae bacterium]|nr:hypothetical protein [Rhizobiaceae bacterium]